MFLNGLEVTKKRTLITWRFNFQQCMMSISFTVAENLF